jgi:hypothetical protein
MTTAFVTRTLLLMVLEAPGCARFYAARRGPDPLRMAANFYGRSAHPIDKLR